MYYAPIQCILNSQTHQSEVLSISIIKIDRYDWYVIVLSDEFFNFITDYKQNSISDPHKELWFKSHVH
jgi:hypothetical protein